MALLPEADSRAVAVRLPNPCNCSSARFCSLRIQSKAVMQLRAVSLTPTRKNLNHAARSIFSRTQVRRS